MAYRIISGLNCTQYRTSRYIPLSLDCCYVRYFYVLQFVSIMFWGIYAIDREVIYPAVLDNTIPFHLNHLWHTTIILCVFAELVIVFHRYPSNMVAALITLAYSCGYIVWIVWVFTVSRTWPYPFFDIIPLPMLPVFFLVSFLIGLGMYFLGKGLCYLRWKGDCPVF